MTPEQLEILTRQILFRHRTKAKGGTPNTDAECAAIRFALAEIGVIAAERAANKPKGSRTRRGRRGHRPTSDGLPREDER